MELARKLAQREYPAADVAAVLDALTADGLLSITRYAEAVVRAHVARGIGPLRIRADLARVQVDEAAIEQALAEADAHWLELAAQARHKRFGADLPADYKARSRQMRFLQQRGFDFDSIRAAMGEE